MTHVNATVSVEIYLVQLANVNLVQWGSQGFKRGLHMLRSQCFKGGIPFQYLVYCGSQGFKREAS